MHREPESDRAIEPPDDRESFLKPGGAFDGPLWQELLEEPCELDTGARVGPYEIRAPIAAGGMGEVYRAFDTRLAREVALKVLPRHSLDSPEAMTRFQREARAVAALNHPNILAIHDVGSEGDLHFAVTELLEGETLRTRLATAGPLVPSKALEYGAQIAHGLAAAHERAIIHRDLKPENVFITNAGRVKILDFGIALHDSPAVAEGDQTMSRLTQTGLLVGTVGYVAPEQLLGQPATARSDLFAFGVVLYEMLTGTHPFRRATTPETQAAILREDPPSLARVVPGLPSPVARMIDLCLQKQVSDRPESARDLALFLEASGNVSNAWPAEAVTAPPVPTPVARRGIGLVAGAIALLTLVTGAMWGVVRFGSSSAIDGQLDADFARAARTVQRVHHDHLDRLALTARLVAAFPELKALLATDVATVEDFLLGFQQRFPRTPLLVAIGPEGAVLGTTDSSGNRAEGGGHDWLTALEGGADHEGTVIAIGNRPHLAVGVPSEAGGTVFGYIVAAEAINQNYAEALSDATQDEVLLLSSNSVLASTLRAGQTPWSSSAAWREAGGRADGSITVQIGSQPYAAREVRLSGSPDVAVVIVQSREEAAAAFTGIQRGVLMVGLTAIALAGLVSYLVGRRRTDTPIV